MKYAVMVQATITKTIEVDAIDKDYATAQASALFSIENDEYAETYAEGIVKVTELEE